MHRNVERPGALGELAFGEAEERRRDGGDGGAQGREEVEEATLGAAEGGEGVHEEDGEGAAHEEPLGSPPLRSLRELSG